MFQQHFTAAELQEIAAEIQKIPVVYGGGDRFALLGDVDPRVVAMLPIGGTPGLQLLGDLTALNRIEVLVSGHIPIVDFLRRAAFVLAGKSSEAVLLGKAVQAEQKSVGAPAVPSPATLPEFPEAIIHQDDMVSFAFMEAGLRAAASVVKILVPRLVGGVPVTAQGSGDPVVHAGTGWLFGADLIMTNHHVVNARRTGETAAAPADFEAQGRAATILFDVDDRSQQGVKAAVVSVEGFDAALDYALLRIAPPGRPALTLAPARLVKAPDGYVPVNVIQHPSGNPKRFAIRNNLLSGTTQTDLRYFTDTYEGSSGAPVFDDSWRVVGLHRGATAAAGVKFQGRDTAFVNVGTQIQAIVEDIQARYPAIAVPA